MGYSPKDIQSIKLFEGLQDTHRLELFEIARRCELPIQTVILKEGEESFSLYAIVRGSVEVTKGIVGKPEHLASLVKGDCFGEMALLEGKSRSATVTTLEATTLLEFEMKALEKLFERQPRIAHKVYQNLARILSARLRATITKS